MKSMSLDAHAKAAGPIAPGHFRTIVIESDAKVRCRDFRTLDEAKKYANDVAREHADAPPIAAVFDGGFKRVYTGKL